MAFGTGQARATYDLTYISQAVHHNFMDSL